MSDNILAQICRGDYCPLEKPFIPDKAYDRMLARKADMEDRFGDALPKAMKKEFVDYLQLCGEMDMMEEESAFCEGVRMGVRLMEAVGGK